jgi:diguanylate cyclase (GGDEF)-like protein
VLFLDLGGFKMVNDRFGHDAGDAALIEIGRRIQGVVRASDTVARLGGDEFVVVCEGLDAQQAHALARRVRRTVSTPIEIGGELVELTVDLGVAVESAPAESDVRFLLVAADRAMYHAKQAAKESSSASPFSD